MRIKMNRKKISFEYEFLNGEVIKVEYLEPTTVMIDSIAEVEDGTMKARLQNIKEILRDCLVGDENHIEAIIEEQTKEANLYDFKNALDDELGKLIKENKNIISFIKTRGKDNGIFSYKLKTPWEVMIYEIFTLSSENCELGLSCNYMVVKDYCKKYELDVIEIFRIIKNIVSNVVAK